MKIPFAETCFDAHSEKRNRLYYKSKQIRRMKLAEKAESYFSACFRAEGFSIIGRDVVIPGKGELDIIANRGNILCACEVKARTLKAGERPEKVFSAEDSIKGKKYACLVNSLYAYAAMNSFLYSHTLLMVLGVYYADASGQLIKSSMYEIK